jgi:hypothetical protein
LAKVKEDLGDRDFSRLRDLFEDYSSAVSPLQMGKLESYQFHMFMRDHTLYTETLDRLGANLLFKKGTKNVHSVHFDMFC